jgi:hypothetical protein
MAQSYAPGTILSIGFDGTLEQVIVLTEDKVATKTFAGHPVSRRDIMSLADWRILAQSLGEEIQTDYLPLPPNPLLPRNLHRPASTYAAPESGRGYLADLSRSAENGSSSATLELSVLLQKYGVISVEEALAMTTVPANITAAVAEPETYAIGTKLSWKQSEDASSSSRYSSNSRTAIVLKDGILQVKEVIHGVVSTNGRKCAQKFFSSIADWKATLPAGGNITITAGQDYSMPLIQRKSGKPIVAETDVDYLGELEKRYSVYSYLHENLSPLEQREALIGQMTKLADEIKQIMQSPAVTDVGNTVSGNVSSAMQRLSYLSKRLGRYACRMANCNTSIWRKPEEAHVKSLSFINKYRQRIVAFVSGREVEITSSKKLGLIGLAWNREQDVIGKWLKPTTGKTFAELGVELKPDGYPRLKIYYRREGMEL